MTSIDNVAGEGAPDPQPESVPSDTGLVQRTVEADPSPGQRPEAAAEEAGSSSALGAGTESPSAAAEESSADVEGASADGGGEGSNSGEEGGAKRKRRRRKKKSPGAAVEGGATSQAGQPGAPAQTKGDKARPKSKAPRPIERPPFAIGEEVFGRVTAVLDTAIMVDLAGKALAIFDRSEMEPDDLVPAVGDRLVARVHQDGSRGGLVVLTRKPLREEDTKPLVEKAYKDGTLINGLITGVIRGGVEVDIGGLRAFAPASGLDLHPSHANFASLLGQVLDFKVIQFDQKGRDVVVTRRPMLESEAHERRKQALTTLTEGQVLRGVVRTVVEWGVFVALPDAENLEGLVHVTEASHDPRPNLPELFKPGQSFEVKILKIDERGKIWLSRRALIEDPWGKVRAQFPVGSKHKGQVTRLEPFGVICSLEGDVPGFIHISDLSLVRVESPDKVVNMGDEIEVVVVHLDGENRRLVLHPAPKAEHAAEEPQRVARNGTLKVEVIKGEPAGLVVRILGTTGRNARGFIPAGQTGTSRGTDLRKTFKVGQLLETKVLDLDRRGEAKLSIQGLKEDEERKAARDYRQKLKAEGGFGTLGDLLRSKLSKAGPEQSNNPVGKENSK